MVIRDGRKMSKHLGNVVDPDELVERYGADAVRLAVLYAARPQRSLNWSDSALARCSRFLAQVWEYSHARLAASGEPGPAAQDAEPEPGGDRPRDTSEHLRTKLASWCEAAVERTTADMEALEMHSAVRNVMRLFDRIKDFEKRAVQREGELSSANGEALLDALALLALLLAPLAPHMAEELLLDLGQQDVAQLPWPGVSFGVPA
jgi:leucyl-tRNA synthetase